MSKDNVSRRNFLKQASFLGLGGVVAPPYLLSDKLTKKNRTFEQWSDDTETENLQLILDPSKVENTFNGIGAVSAGAASRLLIDYPEPARSRLLDYLFKPDFGAGFHHLKVEIGGDINSTDGTEPSHARTRAEMKNPKKEYFERGYEWWLMKEAKKRNPDIILDALAWGVPGWIGDGHFFSQDCADYMASYVLGLKKYHNVTLDYIGTWNEHHFTDKEGAWIKRLRQTLDKRGLKKTNIVANDPHAGPDIWKIADAMAGDRELRNAVDSIGVHYPGIDTSKAALKLQKQGKNLWASEDKYAVGKRCNRNYVARNLTKTEFWSPISSYYDCLVAPNSGLLKANIPWSGAFEVLPRLWQIAHTTQFIKPGWLYLRGQNHKLPKGGSVVCLTSPDQKEISIIAETKGASDPQNLTIKPVKGFNLSALRVWKSNQLEYFIQQPDVSASESKISLKLQPNCNYSLTSTSGQQKGITSGHQSFKSFPLPYSDDFKSYHEGSTPKYLSDFSGAFAVATLDNGKKCLKQQIYQKGIQWLGRIPDSKATFAFTVVGDERWNDVDIRTRASFGKSDISGSKQYIAVIGRFYPRSFACFNQPNPVGYSLRLFGDGLWTITDQDKILSKGKLSDSWRASGWHSMRLKCLKNDIYAFIDDTKVATLTDNRYRNGLVGLGSHLGPVLFDNIKIKSAQPS